MPGRLSRLARMDRAELSWRAAAAARIAADRMHVRVVTPAWDRAALADVLMPCAALTKVRDAAAAARWQDAQQALAAHFTAAPQRFVISPAAKDEVADRIRTEFPQSVAQATARADRVRHGEYDLLGYRGLRFAPLALPGGRAAVHGASPAASHRSTPPAVDWHFDPVLNRRPPFAFWADVPYLDAACGDHKVIWELNRHQHWLALGRAYWLTGDPRYRDRCLVVINA